ncbi:MAG: HAD family hydrolase [Muribaculaceae bacterium]|nr:HAD family hydrolase [Muribaculaceae bacterium]
MKTLFVSDLDGTLMQPDARISDESRRMLNDAIASGALFTIATARTPATVAPILEGINMNLPAIVMTGAALWDSRTNCYSNLRHFSPESAAEIVRIHQQTETPTFLFTLDDNGPIDIYHFGGEMNALQREFVEERINSPFKRFILDRGGADTLPAELNRVILLYTMLPDSKAAATYNLTREVPGVKAQYYHDIYGPEIGILEAFDSSATKANAVKELAKLIGAERIVCFGDNINDLPMMQVADLAVAVENALPEVKAAADLVIGPNTDNSVAKFIIENL